MSNEKNNNTLHVYDGIEEENNPMPNWWIWIFILTVIFAFIYWIHYTFGGGPNLEQEFQLALEANNKKVEIAQNSNVGDTEETLTEFMKVEGNILAGASLYAEKCSMCHGNNLEGKIGPNLTDTFWINGKGTRLDVVGLIAKGIPAKGMPPWEGMLKAAQIKSVAAFVFSKQGSKPPNAKEAQGTEIK